MTVSAGKVVSIAYVLKNDRGEELDRSGTGEPLEYLHGSSQIIAGLEKSLEGLKVGDKKKVTIPPAEAYGEINPELKTTVQRSVFPEKMPIEVGVEFEAMLGDGPAILRIEAINGDDVLVNGNHPLAGETLHFDVEIVSMRTATPEEISHGHAHGPNGHHH